MVDALEISHYSAMLADLSIAAARTSPEDVETLARIRGEMIETFEGIFSLLVHDTGAAAALIRVVA